MSLRQPARTRYLLGALAALAVLAGVGHAGSISISAEIATAVSEGTLRTRIKLTNTGTESAYAVALGVRFVDQSKRVEVTDELVPGSSRIVTGTFRIPDGRRGTFPLYGDILYQDAAGAEFRTATLAAARTGEVPPSEVTLRRIRSPARPWGVIRMEAWAVPPPADRVRVTCHCPGDLSVTPVSQEVAIRDGSGIAEFRFKNVSAKAGSNYMVFFVVEYEKEGVHYLEAVAQHIPIERETPEPAEMPEGPEPQRPPRDLFNPVRLTAAKHPALRWSARALLLAVPCVAAGALCAVFSRRARAWLVRQFVERRAVRLALDLIVLLAIGVFILWHLKPVNYPGFDFLFTSTTTTGGDMASHYYTVQYLRDVLLPSGAVSSWTPANYAGFPILQFYFPLPFLLMCVMNLLLPLQVAFKWGTLLGTFLLPIAAYLMLRLMRLRWPAPILAAASTVPFLFNLTNSMWGANLLSTFAGEFSYSLSFALSLIFLGSLYRGCLDNRRVVLNAALVFLVGFSHGYTLLFAEAVSVFLLMTPRGFVRRAVYLFKVYALGFCFLAFWLVPLLVYSRYTTSYHTAWLIDSARLVLPKVFWPAAFFAVAASVGMAAAVILRRREALRALHPLCFLWFGVVVSVAMYMTAPRLGVVDIRYVPYGQLYVGLIAAAAVGWIGARLARWGLHWTVPILLVPALLCWTGWYVDETPNWEEPRVGLPGTWAKWNYEGFEAKTAWPTFRDINEALEGDFQDPRVVFEHSASPVAHNRFGSTRAFESLPLFAGRATLEGLYMQASIAAPFVFYIQSEVSKEQSTPFPQYSYGALDYDRARRRLSLFNVRDLILVSEEAKNAIRSAEGYRHWKSVGRYELWEHADGDDRYVVPVAFEPVLLESDDWKRDAHRWFLHDELLDVPVVFSGRLSDAEEERFKARAASLDELPQIPIDTADCRVEATVRNREILIETNWIGKPLLVRMSYHPNWHVEGAERVYLVSPTFMLIYPEQESVRLVYGDSAPEVVGKALTVIGLVCVVLGLPLLRKRKRSPWSLIAERIGVAETLEPRIPITLSDRRRWALLVGVLVLGLAGGALVCRHIYVNEPHRLFNQCIKLKDARQYAEAREGFRKVMEAAPTSTLAEEAAFYIAATWYLEKKNREAIGAFEELIRRYPRSIRTPEAHYHIGMCLFRMQQEQAAIERMRQLRREFPNTSWAQSAAARLREHDVPVAD